MFKNVLKIFAVGLASALIEFLFDKSKSGSSDESDNEDTDEVVKCPKCGATMEEAGWLKWYCPNCDNEASYEDGEYYYKCDDEDDYDDNYDIPEECKACGNPAYPECQYGCDIMDDN